MEIRRGARCVQILSIRLTFNMVLDMVPEIKAGSNGVNKYPPSTGF